MTQVYVIDGERTTSLEAFFEEFGRVVLAGVWWGRNLDAFDDVLWGGFGTPNEGFVLRWKNADAARRALGYPETVRQLEARLQRCHPTNRNAVGRKLTAARSGAGPTVFDWLVEIIERHGPAGEDSPGHVRLILD